GLIKQATANPLVLAAALKTELPKLQQSLPTGLNVRIANDTTVFIDKSLEAVFRTILEAIALVALVILLFLGTLRASVIPLVTIPVCLVGACTLMYAAGFSINTLTLLALVLAIGLVVDDAIVVLENIYRHIEEGMKPFEAAIRGTKEVQFAVIAMTLTLAAVFTPIAFTTGRTGRLFVEFALSLAGAVLISGFVALTLTPMMCSRLLRSHAEDAQKKSLSRYVVGAIDSVVEKITSAYALMLRWALRLRWLVLILGLAVGAASAWLFTESKKELTPLEDRGTVVIIFSAPEGSSIDYTTRYGRLIGEIAEKIPEFDRRFVVSGSPTVTQGIGFLRMVDWQDRKRGTAEILKELQPKLLSIPGVLAFAVAPPSLGQSPRVRPINFVVLTSEPYDKLQATVAPFVAELQRHPGLQGVDIDLKLNKPEIKLEIDRQRAADAGVQVEAIGRALETMLGGRQVTRFKRDGEQYDVMVQLDASDRVSPRNIADIYVRGRGDTMVPLASLVSVRESVAPRELNHFAQRRAVTITANLAPGYSLGEAITMMEASAQKY
ncbi:MAG: efflux RND transporter permease subunit, partial [Betaproteobacteria bacterium]|nr:efflux RND transporter permease subunit [Betaproteobacteria bacterium]